jgi:hypothetical protein
VAQADSTGHSHCPTRGAPAGISIASYFTRGFFCTQIAQSSYPEKCPILGRDEMNEAGYVASRLWTNGSIIMVHVTLITTWTAAFMALAFLIGIFTVFQQRQVRPRSKSRGQQLLEDSKEET